MVEAGVAGCREGKIREVMLAPSKVCKAAHLSPSLYSHPIASAHTHTHTHTHTPLPLPAKESDGSQLTFLALEDP